MIATVSVFRLLYKHAIRPANELQSRKDRLIQYASTCPALIPVLINVFTKFFTALSIPNSLILSSQNGESHSSSGAVVVGRSG